jgi:hypothetical protein
MPELRVDEAAAPRLRELRFLRRTHRDLERVVAKIFRLPLHVFHLPSSFLGKQTRGAEFIHRVTNKFRATWRFHCFSASLSAT